MIPGATVFSYFFRTVAAAMLVTGSFLFSLKPVDHQPYRTQAGAELESRSYPAPEGAAYIARHSSAAHSFPGHSRTKVNAKAFFIDPVASLTTGILTSAVYKGLHFLPQLQDAIRPAYYQFLFRYTPF